MPGSGAVVWLLLASGVIERIALFIVYRENLHTIICILSKTLSSQIKPTSLLRIWNNWRAWGSICLIEELSHTSFQKNICGMFKTELLTEVKSWEIYSSSFPEWKLPFCFPVVIYLHNFSRDCGFARFVTLFLKNNKCCINLAQYFRSFSPLISFYFLLFFSFYI